MAPTLSRRTWPVAVVSPVRYALRERISRGEMPSASAIRLRCVSTANAACGAPKPRKAPLGGVFVMAARARIRTFGQAYGPPAWMAPRDRTTGERVVYAPASKTMSMSWATSAPSRVTPVRCRMTDG